MDRDTTRGLMAPMPAGLTPAERGELKALRERDAARALVRELVEALREIDEMPDDPPADYPAEAPDWLLYSRERMSAIARSARLKARAAGYTEEGE